MKLPLFEQDHPTRSDGAPTTEREQRQLEIDDLRDMLSVFESMRKDTDNPALRDESISFLREARERLRHLLSLQNADAEEPEDPRQKY